MDAYVEDPDILFTTVFSHLDKVTQHPQTEKLDDDLLKRAERSLDASTRRDLLWRLLNTGETLLQTLQQDPIPLTRVLERTVLLIPFDDLKTVISPDKLQHGLESSVIPVQRLCLAYLKKASDQPSGASYVAASASLVHCVVTVWLSTESTEIAERSIEVLVSLLDVDSPDTKTVLVTDDKSGEARGQGLLWRRIFHDPDIYRLLFEWTSLRGGKRDLKTRGGMQSLTTSQGRLFDFIARVAGIDWTTVSTSTLPEIEALYVTEHQTSQPYGGLLRYAASDMIDPGDMLMEFLRQDFFQKLLAVIEETANHRLPARMLEALQLDAGVSPQDRDESSGMHL